MLLTTSPLKQNPSFPVLQGDGRAGGHSVSTNRGGNYRSLAQLPSAGPCSPCPHARSDHVTEAEGTVSCSGTMPRRDSLALDREAGRPVSTCQSWRSGTRAVLPVASAGRPGLGVHQPQSRREAEGGVFSPRPAHGQPTANGWGQMPPPEGSPLEDLRDGLTSRGCMPTDPRVHGLLEHSPARGRGQQQVPGRSLVGFSWKLDPLSLFQNKYGTGELKYSFQKHSVMVCFVSS